MSAGRSVPSVAPDPTLDAAPGHPLDTSPDVALRTWATVGAPVLFVPLGSTEQHGPHLGLGTDTTIAAAVAHDLVRRSVAQGQDAAAAPALPYGASGEHEGFPGTISIGTEALARVLIEFGRSASAWAPRIVFVNGHGGNLEAVGQAVTLLRAEGRDAIWLPCDAGTQAGSAEAGGTLDAHAGRTETSVLQHLTPEVVRVDRIEPGATAPLAQIMPALRTRGTRAVSASGVLGDPRGFSADEGRRLLAAMCDNAWARYCGGRVGRDGRLESAP